MPTRTMQVFVSYAASDREIASGLAKHLEKEGFEVWVADARLYPGENWSSAIGQALEDSDAMVVLLSPDSVKSHRVRTEIDFALVSSKYKERLIPVLIKPTKDFPWILENLSIIKAGRNAAETARKIAHALRKA